MYMRFLYLVPLFVILIQANQIPLGRGQNSSCTIGIECPTIFEQEEYNVTEDYLKILTNDAKATSVDERIVITWKPYKSFQSKWKAYMIRWNFFPNPGKVNCRLVPKNLTHLVVENITNPIEIQVKVDTYPLPMNTQVNAKLIRIYYGNKEFSEDVTCTSSTAWPTVSSTSNTPTSGENDVTQVTSSTQGSSVTQVTSSTQGSSDNHPIKKVIIWCAAAIGLVIVTLFIFYITIYKRRFSSDKDKEPVNEAIHLLPQGRTQLSYMVSYYPENETYVDKVASIVNWFRETAGLHMIMDKMATTEICSKGPERWAESQIEKADKVLVFLSPGYNNILRAHNDEAWQQSSDLEKRLWYEMQLLKSTYCSTRSAAKIVCVQHTDHNLNIKELPPWAGVIYNWPTDKDKIVMRLNGTVEIAPAEVTVTVKA